MENYKFTLVSTAGLIGTYASYFIPFLNNSDLTNREILLITLLTSAIFLTIFISSVFIRLNEFKCTIRNLENLQETQEMKINIVKDENEYLKTTLEEHKQSSS